MIKLRFGDIKKHALIWCLIIVCVTILDPIQGGFYLQFFGTILNIASIMITYYGLFLVIYGKFNNKEYLRFAVSFALIYLIFMGLSFCFSHFITDFYRENGVFLMRYSINWIFNDTIIFAIISIVAYGSFQTRIRMIDITRKNENESKILERKLFFYKNQFNSHVTFNFLNYCYHYFNEHKKESAESILVFSEMLRYTISNAPNKEVNLKNEINYIENFIKLKKKLQKDSYVIFNIIGDISEINILPRLLITPIENAFKYGKYNDEKCPIKIDLEVTQSYITLKVYNFKNSPKKRVVSTGKGLENMKQQLLYFYKNNFELDINETERDYQIKLIIKK